VLIAPIWDVPTIRVYNSVAAPRPGFTWDDLLSGLEQLLAMFPTNGDRWSGTEFPGFFSSSTTAIVEDKGSRGYYVQAITTANLSRLNHPQQWVATEGASWAVVTSKNRLVPITGSITPFEHRTLAVMGPAPALNFYGSTVIPRRWGRPVAIGGYTMVESFGFEPLYASDIAYFVPAGGS
jgi:hypothetical protein